MYICTRKEGIKPTGLHLRTAVSSQWVLGIGPGSPGGAAGSVTTEPCSSFSLNHSTTENLQQIITPQQNPFHITVPKNTKFQSRKGFYNSNQLQKLQYKSAEMYFKSHCLLVDKPVWLQVKAFSILFSCVSPPPTSLVTSLSSELCTHSALHISLLGQQLSQSLQGSLWDTSPSAHQDSNRKVTP